MLNNDLPAPDFGSNASLSFCHWTPALLLVHDFGGTGLRFAAGVKSSRISLGTSSSINCAWPGLASEVASFSKTFAETRCKSGVLAASDMSNRCGRRANERDGFSDCEVL